MKGSFLAGVLFQIRQWAHAVVPSMQRYIVDLTRLDVPNDPVRRRVFAQQVDAATQSLRSLAFPGVAVSLILFWVFRGSANTGLLGMGVTVVSAVSITAYFLLPPVVDPNEPKAAAPRFPKLLGFF